MPFEDIHKVKLNENLTSIGQEYGFQTPGPILHFPPNKPRFHGKSGDQIRPGERIRIPYHPDVLTKAIATSRYLVDTTTKDAQALMHAQDLDEAKLSGFLFKIDAINMLASMGASLGSLIAKGPNATMSSKEALLWLAESRLATSGSIVTGVIPAPQAPKKDFKFYVRHALGPWNPSYWTGVAAAISDGDLDAYLYGPAAISHRIKQKIKKQADSDIARLQHRIEQAQVQLSQGYYRIP